MNKFIPLSVPNLKGNELEYVTDAIQSEWVSTGGAYINKFEEAIANYVQTQGAVACQSGTAGLHLALEVSGVGIGDEVIVPTLTFIAAVNPVKYVGAEPVFMDCDDTLCMDMDKVEQFCEEQCEMQDGQLVNLVTGRRIKAIIVVHVFGNLAKMDKAVAISKRYNLVLVEDATEALGTYSIDKQGKKCFAGTFGDYGVYSFNGNKIITCGGGGMIVAKSKSNLERTRYLSTQAKDDPLAYKHDAIGYNYRMTNVQAAIGLAQLEQLESFIQTKACNYKYYEKQMNMVDKVELMPFRQDIMPNYWFYSLVLPVGSEELKNNMIHALQDKGVQTRPIWGLIHEQKPYLSAQVYSIEKATYYYERILNIPCSSNLDIQSIDYVLATIRGCLLRELKQ